MQRIQFKNTCNCLVDYVLLSDAIHHAFPLFRHKKSQKRSICVYGTRRVPAITMKNKSYPVSRLIAQYLWPDALISETVVHHIDEDYFNNMVGNLQIVSLSKHISHHNKGKIRPQYKFNKNEIIPLYKKGWSLDAIAKRYRCSGLTIRRRLIQWGVIPLTPEQIEKERELIGLWHQSKIKIQYVAQKYRMTMAEVLDKLANHAMTKEFQDDLQ